MNLSDKEGAAESLVDRIIFSVGNPQSIPNAGSKGLISNSSLGEYDDESK
jgi:hypothetical protein